MKVPDQFGATWDASGRMINGRILSAINFVLLTAIVMRAQTVTYFIQDSMAVPAEESGSLISTYFTLGAVAAITGSFVPNVIAHKLTLQKLLTSLGQSIRSDGACRRPGVCAALTRCSGVSRHARRFGREYLDRPTG